MVYATAGILAFLVTLIINYDILFRRYEEKERLIEAYNYYRRYLFCIIIYYITDILWGLLYSRHMTVLSFADTTVYFVAMAASVLMWTRFVSAFLEKSDAVIRQYNTVGTVLFGFIMLMLAVNVASPVFFWFSRSGEYHTGWARYAAMGLQIALFVVTGIYALSTGRRVNYSIRFRYFTIGLSSLAMAGFVIAQICLPLLPMYAIGSMLSLCIMHCFVLENVRDDLNMKLKREQDERGRVEKELKSQSELTELMASMSSLLVNMPAMTFSKDVKTGAYLACNQSFAEYAGKTRPDEVVGNTDHQLFDKATADHFVEDDKKAAEMDGPYVFFEDVPDAEGRIIRYLQTTKQIFNDAAGRECLLGLCVDVTETTRIKSEQAADKARQQEIVKKLEMEEDYRKHVEELSFRASHDELTGVYNRLGYNHIMGKVDLTRCYLILFDTDNFKDVNDEYGHETGDKVLIKITTALKNNFRADDYIFRVGGDEFVVIMTNVDERLSSLISAKLERINRELADESDGLPAISLSAGIAHGNGDDDKSKLFGRADKAMYDVKHKGKSSHKFA